MCLGGAGVCVCLGGAGVCVCLGGAGVCVCLGGASVCVCLGVCALAVELRGVCEGALGHSDTLSTLGRPSDEETRGGVKLGLLGRALGLSACGSALSIFMGVTHSESRAGLQSWVVFAALMLSSLGSCLMSCFSSSSSS